MNFIKKTLVILCVQVHWWRNNAHPARRHKDTKNHKVRRTNLSMLLQNLQEFY
jgi:hypothetical protein